MKNMWGVMITDDEGDFMSQDLFSSRSKARQNARESKKNANEFIEKWTAKVVKIVVDSKS